MRVIPKQTHVKMEFFKGIGVFDVIVMAIGGLLAAALFLSDLPLHLFLAIVVLTLTVGLTVPVVDEKGYEMLFSAFRYLVQVHTYGEEPASEDTSEASSRGKLPDLFSKFGKSGKKESRTVESITPFTGIDDAFIRYGSSYYGCVMEITPVEFRFFSESRQDGIIDRVFAGCLRQLQGDETASIVKLDRPVVFDDYIKGEREKMKALKEAYLNDLLNDEELTCRIGIIEDRITELQNLNEKDRVFVPFYYLVYYGKRRDVLRSQVEQTIQALGGSEITCRQLKGPELAIFLKYNYNQSFNEREAYSLQPEQYMDWILPKSVKFGTRTVTYDGLITHNFRVCRYPTLVGNAWGYELFGIPGTRAVMKIKPMDRYRSIRQIDRGIEELTEQLNSTGKASKQMELDTHIQTLGEVLRLLQADNEMLFASDIFITAYDYQYTREMERYKANAGDKTRKKPTPELKKKVKAVASEGGFRLTDLLLRQFYGYASANISANNSFSDDSQSIHSGSVAAVFPFVYKYLMDEKGIFIGKANGVPAFIDFFKRDKDRVNSNMVIIGRSGSGKSYATKTVLTHLAAENCKIFILDPENEYQKMAENFNGKIIDVGSALQGRLNPFHIITNLSDDDDAEERDGANNSLNVHLQFLEEFYRQILPGIDADALEQLNNITLRMYEQKGIDQEADLSGLTPEDYPTFDDLYEIILGDFQTATGDYTKKNLRILLNYISKFATGGRNASLWNGPASISTQENFIVFNFQSLLANKNNTIANAQMLLVLKWLDNEIIKNRDYNIRYHEDRKIVVVIDEAHVFIDSKFPVALDFMFQLAKRIRKYNGMQIVITQNIRDFVGTEELARKSTAIINASQYSMIFPLAPSDMQDLCLLYEKAGAINASEQDDIVNNGRGRAFLIVSPQERTCVDIIAGDGIEQLFTM